MTELSYSDSEPAPRANHMTCPEWYDVAKSFRDTKTLVLGTVCQGLEGYLLRASQPPSLEGEGLEQPRPAELNFFSGYLPGWPRHSYSRTIIFS